MKITFKLSEKSIANAIRKLTDAKDNLLDNVNEFVDVLLTDGADVANEAYGGMATAWGKHDDTDGKGIVKGHIGVTADDEDAAIIAEFGAGYATMEYHPFAKNAPVPIKVASYAKAQYPYGLFYITDDLMPGEGYWFFGGQVYDRVQARHGLLNAYDHITQYGIQIAQEVIRL